MRQTHRGVTTVALALSLFMSALELTVVSTAMPTVVGEVGGIEHYAWVFTAYLLAATVTVPIYGKLADLYGRKPVMLFGIGLFLAGSVASGLSGTIHALIVFRALQGLGAGAMQPIALTIIGDIYTLEQRARVQGAFSGVWGLAGLIGPLAGGLIVKYLSWRWVFFINVPFGLLVIVLLATRFHEKVGRREHSLDWLGAGLLAAGVLALLTGVQQTLPLAVAFPVAGFLLVLFVWVERRAREPVLPLRIFEIREIAIGSGAGALFSGAMFGAITYVPLFVQGVLLGTPTQAGGMITPMIVAWPACSMISGRLLTRVGFRPLIAGGFLLASVGCLLMALLLKPNSSMLIPQIAMGVFGAGLGFAATALLIAVQTSVGWELRGVATASNMFFRTIGGALAIGAMGGVLAARLARDPLIPIQAANALLGPDHGRSLSPDVLRMLGGQLESGLVTNFWIIFALALAAFVTSLFFPERPAGEGRGVSEVLNEGA